MDRDYLFKFKKGTNLLQLELPELTFPQKIKENGLETELIGYFVNYDGVVGTEELLTLIERGDFGKIINSNSEFLLFVRNKLTGELKILTDQFNHFPCYLALHNDGLLISNSFKKLRLSLPKKLHLDEDALLSHILWEWHTTEQTIFKEIKVMPLGTVLCFTPNEMSLKFRSAVDLDSFLSLPIQQYKSTEEFANDWLDMVKRVVKDRYDQVKDLKIGCDLSSGFDCTLVAYALGQIRDSGFTCYSRYSRLAPDETNTYLMSAFAKKHNLNLLSVDTTSFQEYSEEDISKYWDVTDLHQVSYTDFEHYIHGLSNEGVKIKFTGEGGDEIYTANKMDLFSKFPIHYSFFITVMYLKQFGLEKLFNPKLVSYALAAQRYDQRVLYPSITPISSLDSIGGLYERYWEKDIYPMFPLMDTRLIQLARSMPSIATQKNDQKLEVLRSLPQVFPDEMFKRKSGHEHTYINFVERQKELSKKVIANSVLAEAGWIDRDVLLKNLEDKESFLYENDVAIVFQSLIKLDWYLQQNGISI